MKNINEMINEASMQFWFVTNIDTENYIRNFIFEGVRQSLKVINKSKIRSFQIEKDQYYRHHP